jgi:hypothetical protein
VFFSQTSFEFLNNGNRATESSVWVLIGDKGLFSLVSLFQKGHGISPLAAADDVPFYWYADGRTGAELLQESQRLFTKWSALCFQPAQGR